MDSDKNKVTFDIKETDTDADAGLDPTPSLRELARAIKLGRITILPSAYAMTGYPVLWVSLTDLMRLKREIGEDGELKPLKDHSGAV